jgi:hypothetical protein
MTVLKVVPFEVPFDGTLPDGVRVGSITLRVKFEGKFMDDVSILASSSGKLTVIIPGARLRKFKSGSIGLRSDNDTRKERRRRL